MRRTTCVHKGTFTYLDGKKWGELLTPPNILGEKQVTNYWKQIYMNELTLGHFDFSSVVKLLKF